MKSAQTSILHAIRHRHGGPGAVVTPRDFLDLAGRASIDQSLKRLVKAGTLERIGRGLYYLPRTNKALGINLPADPDRVADALGRQTGSVVAPSASATANHLGLSTQIPAKPVYLTSGRSRDVRVGSRVFRLKHASPGRLPDTSTTTGLVLQAIETLGKDPDDAAIARLRRSLTPRDRKRLVERARYCSGRVADIARRVAREAPACEPGSDCG